MTPKFDHYINTTLNSLEVLDEGSFSDKMKRYGKGALAAGVLAGAGSIGDKYDINDRADNLMKSGSRYISNISSRFKDDTNYITVNNFKEHMQDDKAIALRIDMIQKKMGNDRYNDIWSTLSEAISKFEKNEIERSDFLSMLSGIMQLASNDQINKTVKSKYGN